MGYNAVNGLEGTESGIWESNLEVIVKIWEGDSIGLNESGGTGDGKKQTDSKNTQEVTPTSPAMDQRRVEDERGINDALGVLL